MEVERKTQKPHAMEEAASKLMERQKAAWAAATTARANQRANTEARENAQKRNPPAKYRNSSAAVESIMEVFYRTNLTAAPTVESDSGADLDCQMEEAAWKLMERQKAASAAAAALANMVAIENARKPNPPARYRNSSAAVESIMEVFFGSTFTAAPTEESHSDVEWDCPAMDEREQFGDDWLKECPVCEDYFLVRLGKCNMCGLPLKCPVCGAEDYFMVKQSKCNRCGRLVKCRGGL